MEPQQKPEKSKPIKTHSCSHPLAAYNQLYIQHKRPIAVYKKHAKKVLKTSKIILIHGMQASIKKAVRLALSLMEENPDMVQDVQTDTVPTIVEIDGEKKIKEVTAIHIKLEKRLPF